MSASDLGIRTREERYDSYPEELRVLAMSNATVRSLLMHGCAQENFDPVQVLTRVIVVLSEQRDHFQRELVRAVNYGYRLSGGA